MTNRNGWQWREFGSLNKHRHLGVRGEWYKPAPTRTIKEIPYVNPFTLKSPRKFKPNTEWKVPKYLQEVLANSYERSKDDERKYQNTLKPRINKDPRRKMLWSPKKQPSYKNPNVGRKIFRRPPKYSPVKQIFRKALTLFK